MADSGTSLPSPPPGGLDLHITEDFFGLTTDGRIVPGLFDIRSDGVDTAPVRAAAEAFLAALSDEEKSRVAFSIHSTAWRVWSNLDPGWFHRHGLSAADLTDAQNALGTGLLRAALSAGGLDTTERIRRINKAAGEAICAADVFNDDLFYWNFMGTPSATEPWGFQLDGHHLVINYFVLGDQVVMSPCFWGSEPTTIDIDGDTVSVCTEEVDASLAFIRSLTAAQRATAIISATKGGDDMKAGMFADNAVEPYAGINVRELGPAQQGKLLAVAEVFAGRAKDDVAKPRMAEITRHLDRTYAAWIGGTGDDAAFYVRIHSPVAWIEVDCQEPGPLGGAYGMTRGDGPTRLHVHAVARTPNGNDYGRDLLRQHYRTSPHHNGPAGIQR